MYKILSQLDSFVWGPPLLVLLVGTGIYLSLRLGLLQILKLPVPTVAARAVAKAAKLEMSPCPLLSAFFGMATKYAEGVLAIKYRTKDANGEIAGGPMYYILNGMGKRWRPLAVAFSIFGVMVALFGSGTFTQVNSITESLNNAVGLSPKVISPILAIIVAIIIFGGIQSISKVSEKIVPFMATIYILAALIILAFNWKFIIPSIFLIIKSAFSGQAATGGFLGATTMVAIQAGIARGVFSNESGLGSAPIAAAAAKTEEPVEQGLVSMTGTFIDTIIICSLTGLTIIVTGSWSSNLNGATLTQSAFATVFGQFGTYALTVSLILFAFTTILGWGYYGERCFEFLFGTPAITIYRLIFVAMVALGGFLKLEVIWVIADIVNGLMAIPNLVALLALSPVIIKETRRYFSK